MIYQFTVFDKQPIQYWCFMLNLYCTFCLLISFSFLLMQWPQQYLAERWITSWPWHLVFHSISWHYECFMYEGSFYLEISFSSVWGHWNCQSQDQGDLPPQVFSLQLLLQRRPSQGTLCTLLDAGVQFCILTAENKLFSCLPPIFTYPLLPLFVSLSHFLSVVSCISPYLQVTGVVANSEGIAHYILSGTWDDKMESAKIVESSRGCGGSEGKQKTVYQTLQPKLLWKKYPLP